MIFKEYIETYDYIHVDQPLCLKFTSNFFYIIKCLEEDNNVKIKFLYVSDFIHYNFIKQIYKIGCHSIFKNLKIEILDSLEDDEIVLFTNENEFNNYDRIKKIYNILDIKH
jgi:hypothetical protein